MLQTGGDTTPAACNTRAAEMGLDHLHGKIKCGYCIWTPSGFLL